MASSPSPTSSGCVAAITSAVSRLDELAKKQPDDQAHRFASDNERWHQAVDKARDRAVRLLESNSE
ncbi:hypothetical protein GCM10017774_42930 [Lentzea cavernae]|uniref:Excreted virulence factor EspC, type VII ESX diderm n=1 Tax=Lentzea cavernae TaxID=2020703 RepID=A0ABQ3MIH8_9PSEU|nr:hypothetical protein GCM10017774_42930 [Lentzea cavernae]